MAARPRRALKETRRKAPTNLSIDPDLLKSAKAAGINLSGALESRLRELLRDKARKEWLEENREAIEDYNARVERFGVFSDGLRRF